MKRTVPEHWNVLLPRFWFSCSVANPFTCGALPESAAEQKLASKLSLDLTRRKEDIS